MSNKTIHRIIAFSFLVCFGLNVFLQSIILLNFKINQEYIALNLCKEKDVEESTCNGNCQLMKSMEVIEKSTPSQDDTSISVESHITLLFPSSVLEFNLIQKVSQKKLSKQVNNQLVKGFYENPLIPPIS